MRSHASAALPHTSRRSFLKGLHLFQIELRSSYTLVDFREDLKRVYHATGIGGQRTVFLFSDTQVKDPAFLEDINNMLSSGVVPNLYDRDAMAEVADEVRTAGGSWRPALLG